MCLLTVVASAQPSPSQNSRSQPTEAFYRVKGAGGRPVYTNIATQIAPEERAAAEVDLRHVSLNTELGNEIAARFAREHAALTETPFCERLRSAAGSSFVTQLWAEHGTLLSVAGLLVLLLAISPAAMRRFGAPAWTKVLSFAIPLLLAGGMILFALEKTQAKVAQLKAQAQPCTPGALAALGKQDGVLQKHADLIARLKRDMAVVQAESASQLTR